MFASIMDGMKAQRERSTTNRREAAKLFNEHLKNQSDLGIEVTEQSLSDAWDANSGGVLRKHAPTQQRLQGIVTAQNKSRAEKQAVAEIAQMERDQTIRGFNEKALQSFFKTQSGKIPTAEDISALRESLGTNQLRLDDFDTLTGKGTNIASMQSVFDRDQQAPEMEKVMQLIATMKTPDADSLKKVYTNVDPAFIDNAVAQAQKGIDRSNVLEGRDDIKFAQDQEDRVTDLARKIVEQAQADSNFTLNTAQLEAALLKAEVAVKRLVITNTQDDANFAQDFEANVVAAAALAKGAINADIDRIRNMSAEDLAAEQLKIANAQGNKEATYNFGQKQTVDTATNAAADRAVALQPAMDLRSAKADINASFKTATIESVTASLERWGITDPAVITQTWNETRSQQEVFDLTGMTANNNSVDQKLQKATLANQKLVADFKQQNNQTLIANFKSVPVDYHPQINALGQHYVITSNRAQSLRVYIAGEIEKGAWDDANATQVQAALNGWAETNNIPTYSGQMAQMQLNSKNLAGVTQYTPTRFRDVYIDQFQTDAQYAIDLMESASQSNNLAGYDNAKASLATLINETQQDVLAREKDPQKAFGMRASQDEMSKVMSELKVMMKEMFASGQGVSAPEKKVDVDQGLRYDPVLFKPEFGSNTRIRSVDNAISYLENRKSGRALYVTPQQLRDLQDEYKALITSHEADKEELKNTTDTTRAIELDRIIKSNLEQLHEKHFEVGRLVRKVINEGENASSMFNNI
tara:strand:+ start:115 stop:2382 length:2268 start_codon:yes stop_codon:yes gene_type:complete